MHGLRGQISNHAPVNGIGVGNGQVDGLSRGRGSPRRSVPGLAPTGRRRGGPERRRFIITRQSNFSSVDPARRSPVGAVIFVGYRLAPVQTPACAERRLSRGRAGGGLRRWAVARSRRYPIRAPNMSGRPAVPSTPARCKSVRRRVMAHRRATSDGLHLFRSCQYHAASRRPASAVRHLGPHRQIGDVGFATPPSARNLPACRRPP